MLCSHCSNTQIHFEFYWRVESSQKTPKTLTEYRENVYNKKRHLDYFYLMQQGVLALIILVFPSVCNAVCTSMNFLHTCTN